jgi:recombination protein RecA
MSATSLRVVEHSDMDKKKALEAALSQIDRAFGKGSIMKLGVTGKVAEVESVSASAACPRGA